MVELPILSKSPKKSFFLPTDLVAVYKCAGGRTTILDTCSHQLARYLECHLTCDLSAPDFADECYVQPTGNFGCRVLFFCTYTYTCSYCRMLCIHRSWMELSLRHEDLIIHINAREDHFYISVLFVRALLLCIGRKSRGWFIRHLIHINTHEDHLYIIFVCSSAT